MGLGQRQNESKLAVLLKDEMDRAKKNRKGLAEEQGGTNPQEIEVH